MEFAAWMSAMQLRAENALERALPPVDVTPRRLHEALRYVTLAGGKRIRPLLCYAVGEICAAKADRLDMAAAAVELVHIYSLVHDDLPCMDNDALRHGKPSCHVEFDEVTALLTGDALQSLAFQLLGEHTLADTPARQLHMVALLAKAAGSRGMAGGQAIDLAVVGRALTLAELEFMHIHKTGALIRAAVVFGACCGKTLPESEMNHVDHYAKIVGLLFQVVDDILDIEANTATLGKTAGKDAAQNKPTYVSVLGFARAKEKAADLRAQAHQALAPFGPAAARLHALTDFIVDRRF